MSQIQSHCARNWGRPGQIVCPSPIKKIFLDHLPRCSRAFWVEFTCTLRALVGFLQREKSSSLCLSGPVMYL